MIFKKYGSYPPKKKEKLPGLKRWIVRKIIGRRFAIYNAVIEMSNEELNGIQGNMTISINTCFVVPKDFKYRMNTATVYDKNLWIKETKYNPWKE